MYASAVKAQPFLAPESPVLVGVRRPARQVRDAGLGQRSAAVMGVVWLHHLVTAAAGTHTQRARTLQSAVGQTVLLLSA
jgi:hypothetical protein